MKKKWVVFLVLIAGCSSKPGVELPKAQTLSQSDLNYLNSVVPLTDAETAALSEVE